MTNATIDIIKETVPFAVDKPDQVPAKRYYDKEFYELENKHFWPKVWQMACRLEEIQRPGDYVVYKINDQSVVVVRIDDKTIKAYHNHCRHRGVELVQDRGHLARGFVCPFHGWRWNTAGESTYVFEPAAFSAENMCKDELNLVSVRSDTWGGCVFINFDDKAAPLKDSLGVFGTTFDAWKAEDLQVEWWLAARLPVNWKLAMEAFVEGYHVATTHPQLLPPGASSRPGDPGEVSYLKVPDENICMSLWMTVAAKQMPTEVASKEFIDMNIHFMRTLSIGTAGMTHDREVKIAESLANLELPKNPMEATVVFRRALNEAVMSYYREQGHDIPDLNFLDEHHLSISVNYAFPNYFLLPTNGSASSYRIRPLGPEECLFELWSLTRFPEGEKPKRPLQTPTPMEFDDPRWPPIPKQDFSNLPKQQRGLHNSAFEFMRLSDQMEGMIGNYHRLIDAYIAGASHEELVRAVQGVSGPIDMPVNDLGFGK